MSKLTREDLSYLQVLLDRLREPADDYVIVSVGVRGPNNDCHEGNAVATVRMGHDEATCEALYLPDAIALARAKLARARATKAKEPANG